MKHTVAHPLGSATAAREAVEAAFSHYRERFADHGPTLAWSGSNAAEVGFRALGRTLRAKLVVDDRSLTVEGDVPLLLRAFEGKMREVITREAERWLARRASAEAG